MSLLYLLHQRFFASLRLSTAFDLSQLKFKKNLKKHRLDVFNTNTSSTIFMLKMVKET